MADNRLSFRITSPADFLAKLKLERESLESDLTSSRHAINAAMTAWHLLEWVWGGAIQDDNATRLRLGAASKDFPTFRQFVLDKCPAMETMRCIGEGSKHFGGTAGTGVIETREHGGAFSSGFSKAFDISRLEVQKSDRTTAYFDLELDAVIQFWEDFFSRYLTAPGA